MRSVNIQDAKTHLSRLLEAAVRGEPFIIAKAGKPLVMVTRIDGAAAPGKSRLGFAAGRFKVPDDVDTTSTEDIGELFEGDRG